jgi:hypothetical protein
MRKKINTQLFLDLSVSGFFVLLSMISIAQIIPKGATYDFLMRGYLFVALLFIIISTLFFIFWIFEKDFKLKKKIELPKLKDLILLALPMTPVAGYAITNIEYLNSFGLIYVIIVPFIFSLILSFVIPVLLSYIASFEMLMVSGLSISFTILSMPKVIQNPSSHLFNSQFVTQGLYLIISFTIVFLIYIFKKRIAYIAIFVFFLTGAIESFYIYFENKKLSSNQIDNRLERFLNNDQNNINNKKNVNILVYESYANQEMLDHYGFDNSKQIKFLQENNFIVYNGIYSNAAQSIGSTSRILNIKGNLSKHGRYYTSGNAFGLNIFKANGYKTFGLFTSPFFFSQYPITWDEYYPKSDVTKMGGKTILKGIYEGEFRFNIFDDDHDYERYLELKNKFLISKSEKPTLFYTHNSYPGHSGNSGKCHPDEKQIYFNGMKKANAEMRTDINDVIKNNSNSIIIIVSDHGPYLTKNCYNLMGYDQSSIDKHDLQDRYGVFLAIHWPKDMNINNFDVEISQDIFPAILGNITSNKNLFEELKVDRKFFDRFNNNVGGVNVLNGIIKGGKNNGEPLFENRSYILTK